MNTVQYIIKNRPLSYEDKITAKALGRPTPNLQIKKTFTGRNREFNRYFKKDNAYGRFSWMCGCEEVNKVFCFICLLSNDLRSSPWIVQGVNDLQHLQERAAKHEKSPNHLHHLVDYSVLGRPGIRQQLDSAYVINLREHNEKVNKNRHILRRLIMCVKFCGAFELALRRQDTRDEDQGIFRGLVDFASELDSVLSHQLKNTSVFSSETIQNELLDSMLKVCRNEIIEQVTKANFVAIEADETTDSFDQKQLLIIFRYVFEGELFERFWGFVRPTGITPDNIAHAITKELEFLEIPASKLIAQSYDVIGVESIIRQEYPGAFYIHSYAHPFNLLIEKAASCSKKLKIFFAEVQSFAQFFSKSPRRISLLDEIAEKWLPKGTTAWNIEAKIINILYEDIEFIRTCLENALDTENDSKTISEISGLLRILNSSDFNYFLQIVYYITPHFENFFNQVQRCGANNLYIQNCLQEMQAEIIEGERKFDPLDPLESSSAKRPRLDTSEDNRVIVEKYCEMLLNQVKDRYDFTGHLFAAALFSPDLIHTYKEHFPEDNFQSTVGAYSFLDKEKLRTELKVIYSRDDMRCDGVLPLLTFLNKNNLQEGLSETYKLLDILCTTPMITSEKERCFSTLKRVKCFLRNTRSQERLNAFAMLSMEKKLVQSIDDFDNKVISVFASHENRKRDFNYK